MDTSSNQLRRSVGSRSPDLNVGVETLKNVGARNLPRLRALGIYTVKDLIWHFPTRYEDYTRVVPIDEVKAGERVNVQGEVVKISLKRIFPRRISIVEAIIKDDSGAIKAIWFNQPYIAETLPEGTFVSLAGKAATGKYGLNLQSPTYEKIQNGHGFQEHGLTHTQGLVPVYPETDGITSKYIRYLLKPILAQVNIPDPLPERIREKYDFPSLTNAILSIHNPSALPEAQQAKERLAFDDLLLFQIKALLERRKLNQLKSIPIPFQKDLIKDFVASLPFELTTDQRVAAWEILKDLERSYPMNRLMEGDVGSGKTVVALIAAYQVAKSGFQAAFLAPTEVLAVQHFKTISQLTKNTGLRIALMTGSTSILDLEKIKKPELKKEIEKGNADIVIGTHAVIEKNVVFSKLALVIIDEQHRFGVKQRATLVKGSELELIPHLLSMTATPIPRTLALSIYGDLDISIIKEKPKNRQKIITHIITPSKRKESYDFIREEVKKGRQVFVVCPRIELSNPQSEVKTSGKQSKMNVLWADVKAVEEEYKKLSSEIFPDLQILMLHGKLKSDEKREIMERFRKGEADILVSTSVIEVGVDIPNATLMMIENAERFGLAQLHQFRGRVGRGEHQSYCLLFSSTGERITNERLKALVATDDGFLLAEKDMAIRGPGEFFGAKQSGLPDLAMASLANINLIKKARLEARVLLKEDPNLKKYSLLTERLEKFQRLTHFE